MHGIRGEFVDNHIHVTKHSEKEMYAAGSVQANAELPTQLPFLIHPTDPLRARQ